MRSILYADRRKDGKKYTQTKGTKALYTAMINQPGWDGEMEQVMRICVAEAEEV